MDHSEPSEPILDQYPTMAWSCSPRTHEGHVTGTQGNFWQWITEIGAHEEFKPSTVRQPPVSQRILDWSSHRAQRIHDEPGAVHAARIASLVSPPHIHQGSRGLDESHGLEGIECGANSACHAEGVGD